VSLIPQLDGFVAYGLSRHDGPITLIPGGRAVFRRLRVDHLVQGQTRVSWETARWFCDPGPWEFMPQIGSVAVQTGDWADLLDDWAREIFTVLVGPIPAGGRNPTTHFRVLMRTSRGTYVSPTHGIYGTLPARDWVRARVIVHKERLRFRRAGVVRGWLLKRKRVGEIPDPADPAAAVTDYLTGGITRSKDTRTVGTEFLGGFYAPVPYELDADPAGLYEQRDDQRGMVDDDSLVRAARIVHDPPVAHWDAFVADQSDLRFYFHKLEHIAEIGMVPLVSRAELRLAPFDDVIYSVAVPETRDVVRRVCP
jgi:hypothetical protein